MPRGKGLQVRERIEKHFPFEGRILPPPPTVNGPGFPSQPPPPPLTQGMGLPVSLRYNPAVMKRRWALFAVWFLLFPLLAAGPVGLPPLIVVVDAGHGGEDPGAVVAGVREKDIVLDIALRIFELSRDGPVQVVLTRMTDRYVDLVERVRFAEEVGAVLYLTVHANYSADARVRGVEVWVANTRRAGDPSWELARAVLRALVRQTGAADRGVRSQKLYLRHTRLPAALVEVGYLSNPAERRLLLDPGYRERVARGILEGIHGFLGL